MNTILQKRIEEAAETSITETLMSTPNYEFSPKATDMLECAYIKGAEDILNNQWISVEEALPPHDDRLKTISIDVIVRNEYGKATSAWYDYANKVWHLLYGEIAGDDLIDSKITHWMPIPEMKGGEK